MRELEQIMLEAAGYRVHPAADAAEALELARRYAFDLLVVDVVMPGLSGPQLADELRARGCDLPTLFVSGYGTRPPPDSPLEPPARTRPDDHSGP